MYLYIIITINKIYNFGKAGLLLELCAMFTTHSSLMNQIQPMKSVIWLKRRGQLPYSDRFIY